MGLFDAVREKAAELLSGATEKVSELTGTDLADTARNAEEAAGGHVDAATEAGQQLADDATGSVTGTVTSTATDAAAEVAESPAGDPLDPYRQ